MHTTCIWPSVSHIRGICTPSPMNGRERLIFSHILFHIYMTALHVGFPLFMNLSSLLSSNIFISFIRNNQRSPVIVQAQKTRLKKKKLKKNCKMPSREKSDNLSGEAFLGLNMKRYTVMQNPLHYLYYIKFSLFYPAVYHQCSAHCSFLQKVQSYRFKAESEGEKTGVFHSQSKAYMRPLGKSMAMI